MDDRGRHETVAEMLAAWDRGETVWTVEMGGLGPGYEQAIQVLAMECLRELQDNGFVWPPGDPNAPLAKASSDLLRAKLDRVTERVDNWPGCGFSGAQVGAAYQIACRFHRLGPIVALDTAPQDRRTMICKTWPHEPESAPAGETGGGSRARARSAGGTLIVGRSSRLPTSMRASLLNAQSTHARPRNRRVPTLDGARAVYG